MLRFLHFFEDLANAAVLALLNLLDLAHNVFEKVLDKHLGLFVRVEPLVDLDPDHFTKLVRYLRLAVLEPINFVPHSIVDLGNFTTERHLLLCPGHLFLTDPAVDASDLCLEVRAQRLDRLVLALELLTDVRVHLVITLAHLFHSLSALLLLHAVLHLHLVPNIVNLSSALFLLTQQAVDKIGNFDFKALLSIILQLAQQVTEIVGVFESGDLNTADILLVLPLLHTHERYVLLKSHKLGLNSLKDFVEELRCSITLATNHGVVTVNHGETLL